MAADLESTAAAAYAAVVGVDSIVEFTRFVEGASPPSALEDLDWTTKSRRLTYGVSHIDGVDESSQANATRQLVD